jgi:DNA polymerase III sliding clamp (beta) subunit (PCNA family)
MCRKTEGRFPNVKGVIPTSDAPIVVETVKKDFVACVKRAMMSANATNPIIRLVASQANDALCIESEDIDNNRASMERVRKTHTGDDITIGFSGTNLLLAMDAVDDDVVSLHLTADVRPMVVHDALHSRETILIMPMMIRK